MTAIDELLQLDDDDFAELVKDEARGRALPEICRALRSPSLRRRWYLALMSMLISVECQLGAMREEKVNRVQGLQREGHTAEAAAEEVRWRTWKASSLRFRAGIAERLVEARELLSSANDPFINDRMAKERKEALVRAAILEDAIARHREQFVDESDASEEDRRLWSLIA